MSSFLDRLKGAFSGAGKGWGTPPPGAAEAMEASLPAPLLAKLAAAVSDSYRLEREVGAGGMALVFQARDVKHDREVALKVLKPDLASRVGRERFLREIQLAARLTHPHILPLHDSGDAAGLLYYVMPYVGGPSLKRRLREEGPLSVDEAVDIARAVASALDYAHRQGVVHRDIKPANIMMNQGVAVVADFGIGKALSEAGVGDATLTQEGMLIGTPAYMSPEQTKEGAVDGRSDIYSLGLVLHELLTGAPLFTGTTPIALLVQRAREPLPELRYPGFVPADVQAVIRRALAESPEDRFASGADFATALAGARHALSDTFTPPATPAAGAEDSIAVLPFTNMSGDPESEYFSDGVTEEIINALTRLPGLRVAARTSSFAFKGQSTDVMEVGRRLGVATVLEGSVRQAGDRLRVTAQLIKAADGYHLWSERWDRELDDVFEVQDEIAAAIADRLQVTLAASGPALARPPTSNVEAYRLYLKGRHLWNHRDEDSLLKAVDYFQRAIERDPDFAHAHSGLADTYLLLGSYRIIDREESNEKAKAAAKRACELDDTLAEAHTSMGQVLRRERDWEGEERAYRRAIELNPNYATAHQWYSTLLAAQGRMDEAVREVKRAEMLDPLSHAILVTSAIVHDLARDVDCALRKIERALEMEPDFASAVGYSGWIYAERGMFDEAFRANDLMAKIWGADAGGVIAHRANIHALMGEQEKGRTLLEEAIALGGDPGYVGYVWTALGEHDRAFECLNRAIDENSWFVFHLKVHPALDPLRSDPRFDLLLERLGLG
jgi:serine/threonine-protein kinase